MERRGVTLLVFGKTGQVARELRRQFDVRALGRDEADLTDPEGCAAVIRRLRPRVVINAAAYTAVDRAESEEALARVINGEAPGAMAAACAELGVPFLHVSTDYVFDGSGTRPWRPDDEPAPVGAYGRSKLAGERAVAAAGGQFAVLRTSWVFSAHGANFVKTMLRLAKERDELGVVADQTGGPTPAAAIAAALLQMAERMAEDSGKGGIHHFSGKPDVTWADFARAIFAEAGLEVRVRDIATADFPTPARRPANSRLDCSSLQREFAIERPDWRQALRDVLADLQPG